MTRPRPRSSPPEARFDAWCWALIFAGIVLATVGLWIDPREAGLRLALLLAGGLAGLVGAAMVLLRARRSESARRRPTPPASPSGD